MHAITVDEIFDASDLRAEINDGYVTERRHPKYGELAIYNYTPTAAYEHRWNEVTLNTRGLIVNTDTREVVARPFKKFFNSDQPEAPQTSLERPVMGVFDKADGSLLIEYVAPDGTLWGATRGSFESAQAKRGTEFLRMHEGLEAYANQPTGITRLYEVVYPDNRIVLDYKGFEGLYYLGSIVNEDGQYVPPSSPGWADLQRPGKYVRVVAEYTGASTYREALSPEPRENAEGVVIWLDPWTAVKVKQEEYIALHKIVTGLNRKEVWRQLVAGTYHNWAKQLPDEFYQWASVISRELDDEALGIEEAVSREYSHAIDGISTPLGLGDREARKTFALRVKDSEYKKFLFARLDGRDIYQMALESVEPKGE